MPRLFVEDLVPSAPSVINTTIVQAGAGTGKTESLARRIIETAEYFHGLKQRPPRFVATTFTERATSELRERVVSILSRRSDAPLWLTEFVQDPEKLHISTIHGTLSLILHRFGQLLGLDPEFVILSTAEERELLSRVLRATLSTETHLGILLEHYPFPELVTLIRDLTSHWRLHKDQARPESGWRAVLEKDRLELLEALKFLKSADLQALTANQAAKISQISGLLEPLEKLGNDYDRIRAFFLRSLDEVRKPALREGGRGSELKPALDFIFDLKNEKWSTESYDPLINARHGEVAKLLTELVRLSSGAVEEIKKQEGCLTFDDLEFLALDLVENHAEALASIRQEWDFWFVDEFQDTSPLQKKLLFQFFKTPWNAYFVGDPQQSIYLFRGADENVFQETKALVKKGEGTLENLTVNYRSEPDLLHFMNELFTGMKTPMGRLEGRGPRKNEIRAVVSLAEKDVQESALIINQIFEWRKAGHPFHDVAVLVRTNDKARQIARSLSAVGVPVYIHASGGYYDRREVLDALGLLSFLEDPSDDEVFILLARSPWVGIPDEILARWGLARGGQAKRISYWDWLRENPTEFDNFLPLKVLAEAVVEAETRPLSTVYEKIIERLGLLEFCLAGDASGRREANLRKMLFSLKEAESRPGFSAALFMESAWRELIEPGDETEAASFIEPQRVNIMTIHKSKGLKFNCVIVPHCGEGLRSKGSFLELAPDGRWAVRVLAIESEEKVAPLGQLILREERYEREMAESNRVFYVAVTRAAERVCLIGKRDFDEKSWMAQVGLDLSEGAHDGYIVRHWTEEPVLEKVKAESEVALIRAREPVPPPSRLCHEMNVTQLVSARLEKEKLAEMKNFSPSAYFLSQIEFQQRGQAIHDIFDQLKKNPQMEIKKLCELARTRFPTRLNIKPELITGTLEISEPPLKGLIENGVTEWPFTLRTEGISLQGQIDLWGDVGDWTWIVDYKSAESFTDFALEKAREQLELYALAVHKTGRAWERLRLAVVAPLQIKAKIFTPRPLNEVKSRLQPIQIDHWGEANI